MHHIKTVQDLKQFLEKKRLSPEAFSKITNVSHMTWRRLLNAPSHSLIKDKYKAIIIHSFPSDFVDKITQFELGSAASLDPEEIVKTGMNQNSLGIERKLAQDGEHVASLSVILSQSKHKLEHLVNHSQMSRMIKELFKHLRSSHSHFHKTMIVGALVYFVNPFDLIADSIMPLGLIDDLGVISIVLKKIHKEINVKK